MTKQAKTEQRIPLDAKQCSGRRISSSYKLLICVFIVSLPFLNPWVRGDGVGYYAYARAVLIQHNLDFEYDWQHANTSFRMFQLDADGRVAAHNYTTTHHIDNHFAVGAAILWLPFLVVVHGMLTALNHFGMHFRADGYSKPYLFTMAIATAAYGFAGLCLSFAMAKQYVEERWALLATIGIWFGSSLPVYMYLNPSWSHAHSAFCVGLFLWYWHKTRGHRSLTQWVVLGAVSGLMVDVYFPNAILLIVPATEALVSYVRSYRDPRRGWPAIIQMARNHLAYVSAALLAFVPTLVTRYIIYGNAFYSGYAVRWFWKHPKLLDVMFSSNHGVFSWTPLLLLAVFGLALMWKRDRFIAACFVFTFVAYVYLIGSYQDWHGISSFGNRFFVSLTPLFVLGLSLILSGFRAIFVSQRQAFLSAVLFVAVFVLWNAGLIFQWGMHLIPVRGSVDWVMVTHNQFLVVPGKVIETSRNYLFRRSEVMQKIENQDVEQLRQDTAN